MPALPPITEPDVIQRELRYRGGRWIGEARRWIQWNVKGGDRLQWGSNQTVTLTVQELEDMACAAAAGALADERERNR